MRIAIAGVGKVGRTLVELLVGEGHEVVAIDQNSDVLEHVSAACDVMTVCGGASIRSVLEEAGVPKCSLMIAATDSDEVNILSCLIARSLGVWHTIARIRSTEYSAQIDFMRDNLGISMAINPEHTAAGDIFNTLRFPAARKIEYFSRGQVQLVEFKLENSRLDGVKLNEFYRKYQVKVLVITVMRGDRLVIPNGDFILHDGDVIEVIGAPSAIEHLFRLIGELRSGVRSVMLLGGGRISYYLAKMLLEAGVSVSIIDREHERCTELSEVLPGATVIEGNGTDRELLLEEGIDTMDAFVSLTGIDEENIITALYAKQQGVGKVVTKVNNTALRSLMTGFGLDSVVSPHELTANHILSYVRSLDGVVSSDVETLYKLADGLAEAVEFRVREEVPGVTGIPLRDLHMRSGLLIATITHNGKITIPLGGDFISAGDRVIIISGNYRLSEISDILA